PVRLRPGDPAWARSVRGTTRGGRLGEVAVLALPGVDRRSSATVVLEAEGGPSLLEVRMEGAPALRLPVDGPRLLSIPLAPGQPPGVQMTIRPETRSPPVRLRVIEVVSGRREARGAILLAAIAGAAIALLLPWKAAPATASALALLAVGLLGLASTPALLLRALPAAPAMGRLAVPAAAVVAGIVVGARTSERSRFVRLAAILAAFVLGGAARLYFLPSAGSWDVDYWKACAVRTDAHGVTRAYGDPDAVPPGHFLAQMRGSEPQWELPADGRSFVIDQPPGIMFLWQTSWRILSRVDVGLTPDEALNAAAKLPAVLGDVLAVVVLVAALGLSRGLPLAAIYWALPLSWLPSAVLGFFDGAYAPLAVGALVLAGRGRAAACGAALAVAALVKSLALLFAPAAAIALRAVRAPLRPAVAIGLAVVLLAVVPFAVDGTLATAVVHLYRILFQQRLSGGYANVWWIAGHLASGASAGEPVPYVRVDALPSAARLGTPLFLVALFWIARCQLRATGPRAAALAGAALMVAYGQLAIGVHENHPHGFVLALFASGLGTRRLRWMAGTLFTTYLLNMLALSGLGRFYGLRHLAVHDLAGSVAALRMAAGFDLTLALAAVNVVTFAILLASLPREMAAASLSPPAAGHPPAPPS
ncbi:MAG TPA: hypothetical protein VFM29_07965, partial [Vicinamibacteria bacterium]|nr:hypothetical protein [Vicinamibacteria bacterium]